MRTPRALAEAAGLCAFLTLGAPSVRAADAPAGPPSQAAVGPAAGSASAASLTYAMLAEPSRAWHLYSGFGAGSAGGGYGAFLERPLQFELRIAKQTTSGAWRFGTGLQFGSMDLKPAVIPAGSPPQEEWARLETFGSVTRVFNPERRFRPYFQARLGMVRVHPRSELFFNKEGELEPGESPTLATNGIGLTLQPGFEIGLRDDLALDVAGFWTAYRTGAYALDPIGLPPVDGGREWGVRLGLAWRPFAGTPPDPARKPLLFDKATGRPLPLAPPDASRDAWGVPRSWGWATAEMLAINFGASMFNEYVRDANFNQISPRSFWANIQEGFTYDDNKFKTNQLIHPFNGATYFNAARANGIGFWGSSAMSVVGAFVWECCGETHPMAFNDMVSTGIGGIARGELAYRVSSLILDNTKRGKGRVGREAAAFLFNPIRGFNRILTGDASELKGNPSHPFDWRPTFQLHIRAGARVIGEGESITENTNSYGFLETGLSYGDAWDPDNRRPYDRFDAISQSNFGDKTRVGRLLIRGDLFSRLVGANHSLALQQDFDYIDNEAFEYGGQSLGPALLSRFALSKALELDTRVQAYFILLGAVNSDLSFLADVANQERFREYDYGPGAGASLELYLLRKHRPLLVGRYRYSYIGVSNGSVYNSDTAELGLNSNHNIHQLQLKLELPISKSLSAGADSSVFFRRSHYDFAGSGVPPEIGEGRRTITQRNPELRLFLAFSFSN